MVSASCFINEDRMCEYHSMEDLVLSIVGTVLGCEDCACSCRDVLCDSVMGVHLNDVRMKDVSKKSL